MLANIKLKAIEKLKMTRAEEYDHDKIFEDSSSDHPNDDSLETNPTHEDCVDNKSVYDEDGTFLPYSTIINTIEQHKALCSVYKT